MFFKKGVVSLLIIGLALTLFIVVAVVFGPVIVRRLGQLSLRQEKQRSLAEEGRFPNLTLDFFDATVVHPDARGFQLAFYEKNQKRILFIPWGGGDEPLGTILAYHTDSDFSSPASYEAVDLEKLVDPNAYGFGAGFMDTNHDWLYLNPFRKGKTGAILPNTLAVRFNLHKNLTDPSAYEKVDLAPLGLDDKHIGWVHGAYAGGFAYFVPTFSQTFAHGIFLRYDTSKPFNDISAWSYFDLVKNVSPYARGFQSAELKLPYIYLIPYTPNFNYLVRYNVNKPFNDPASYELVDLTTLNSDAIGYTLSVVVGDSIVFTPWRDIDAPQREQSKKTAAIYDTRKSLSDSSAWSFIDLTTVDPEAEGYMGGWLDKDGFVYFVPTANFAVGKVPPILAWNSAQPFDISSSWKAFSSQGVTPSTGAAYVADSDYALFAPYGYSKNPTGIITRAKIKRVQTLDPNQDSDNDGFSDIVEKYLGTDPLKRCTDPATRPKDNNPSQTWPLDLLTGGSGLNRINLQDVNSFNTPTHYFGTKRGDPNFNRRWDLNADGEINQQDLDKYTPDLMNTACTP